MMKIIERIFKDNLPANSIVQSYKSQICNTVEEGMWEVWKHLKEMSDDTLPTKAFKDFINTEVKHGK